MLTSKHVRELYEMGNPAGAEELRAERNRLSRLLREVRLEFLSGEKEDIYDETMLAALNGCIAYDETRELRGGAGGCGTYREKYTKAPLSNSMVWLINACAHRALTQSQYERVIMSALECSDRASELRLQDEISYLWDCSTCRGSGLGMSFDNDTRCHACKGRGIRDIDY